jgi:hypothetical protein
MSEHFVKEFCHGRLYTFACGLLHNTMIAQSLLLLDDSRC